MLPNLGNAVCHVGELFVVQYRLVGIDVNVTFTFYMTVRILKSNGESIENPRNLTFSNLIYSYSIK